MFRRKAAVMPRSIWAVTPATLPTRRAKSGKQEFDYHLTKASRRSASTATTPRTQRYQGAPGTAVRYRQLRAVPRSAPVSPAEADADVYSSAVCG